MSRSFRSYICWSWRLPPLYWPRDSIAPVFFWRVYTRSINCMRDSKRSIWRCGKNRDLLTFRSRKQRVMPSLERNVVQLLWSCVMLSACPSICLSWTGVHCDQWSYMVHLSANLNLWLDSPIQCSGHWNYTNWGLLIGTYVFHFTSFILYQ